VARVLVMDDEDELRGVLVRALERARHEAFEVEDGAAGLRVVKARPLDLVVTDLVMPEMDGLEFIRELGRLRPGTRVIAISGGGIWDKESLLAVAGMLGALKTLSKPFELADFLALVDEVLSPNAG
jgi:two-component system, chemotaxis family, chemotaxis protein CheY